MPDKIQNWKGERESMPPCIHEVLTGILVPPLNKILYYLCKNCGATFSRSLTPISKDDAMRVTVTSSVTGENYGPY
jgi:hypothetical protein